MSNTPEREIGMVRQDKKAYGLILGMLGMLGLVAFMLSLVMANGTRTTGSTSRRWRHRLVYTYLG